MRQMLRGMPWKDLMRWQAYDAIEPIGGVRGDWQSASVCSSVMNAMAISHGSRKRFRTQDFLLEFTDEERPKVEVQAQGQTWQEMRMYAQMFALSSTSKKKWKR